MHGTPPAVIGLTGGIASGKTTVAARLAELGAAIIDADRIGHDILAPGAPAYRPVLEAFGPDILAPDGAIDRRKLGARVFADPARLERLNGISHPIMARRMAEEIAALRARLPAHRPPLIVLDAAILLEAGWDRLCDSVWTVEAPPDAALARLVARNGLTEEQARLRLNAQWSNAERAGRAQRVIANSGTIDALRDAVSLLWREAVSRCGAAS
ncbi:MAG: dephospho-CoA kinase [SAR324 cluster bacterium]